MHVPRLQLIGGYRPPRVHSAPWPWRVSQDPILRNFSIRTSDQGVSDLSHENIEDDDGDGLFVARREGPGFCSQRRLWVVKWKGIMGRERD